VIVARLVERSEERCRGPQWDAALERLAERSADPWQLADELLDGTDPAPG
jgi:hypothetical protein